ncbi:hypothetical protein CBR_g41673 [Chara braunii]|uniref:Uncharacterized protein n=1 Tax=Chara braunii TaxID=69332 RepID=A0A388LWL9_CHABU|nr:hypothetical protein CBR_g41673 [Chara braunii]|eukprot:GBG86609.1 hypothetical protein CBR_g41673 [Chara braunii]
MRELMVSAATATTGITVASGTIRVMAGSDSGSNGVGVTRIVIGMIDLTGSMVDIPDDDESEISRVRRELEELKARCAGEKAESSLEALRREKDALQRAQSKSSEEENLRKEIEMLKARNEKGRFADAVSEISRSDEIAALRLQIHELEGVRAALEARGNELGNLKSENAALKKDFQALKGEISEIKNANNKRASDIVTEKSPPAEPDMGKQRMAPIDEAVYTPKDLKALHKAFKKAQAGEEMPIGRCKLLKSVWRIWGLSC